MHWYTTVRTKSFQRFDEISLPGYVREYRTIRPPYLFGHIDLLRGIGGGKILLYCLYEESLKIYAGVVTALVNPKPDDLTSEDDHRLGVLGMK